MIETRQGSGAFVAENPKSLNFRFNRTVNLRCCTSSSCAR